MSMWQDSLGASSVPFRPFSQKGELLGNGSSSSASDKEEKISSKLFLFHRSELDIFWLIDESSKSRSFSLFLQSLSNSTGKGSGVKLLRSSRLQRLNGFLSPTGLLFAASDKAAVTSSPTRVFNLEPLLGEIPTWPEASSCTRALSNM